MTRVKICGITNAGDAVAAIDAGADMIGFVFAPSARQVTPAAVKEIIGELSHMVVTVGVFANEDTSHAALISQDCGIDMLQLHGAVSGDCAVDLPIIRAVSRPADLECVQLSNWRYVLLDGFHPSLHGGTGRVCDWTAASRIARLQDLFLAGGLTPENVGEALSQVRPYAVDVSSGVEHAPGRKDHKKIQHFIHEVRSWECRMRAAISGNSVDGLSPKH